MNWIFIGKTHIDVESILFFFFIKRNKNFFHWYENVNIRIEIFIINVEFCVISTRSRPILQLWLWDQKIEYFVDIELYIKLLLVWLRMYVCMCVKLWVDRGDWSLTSSNQIMDSLRQILQNGSARVFSSQDYSISKPFIYNRFAKLLYKTGNSRPFAFRRNALFCSPLHREYSTYSFLRTCYF